MRGQLADLARTRNVAVNVVLEEVIYPMVPQRRLLDAQEIAAIGIRRPPLPPGMPLGGHGGSHGYLTNEFILSVLEDRKPCIDITAALNMTVPGIVAHESAIRDGEWLKIPQYS